jgi:hypothetical protein
MTFNTWDLNIFEIVNAKGYLTLNDANRVHKDPKTAINKIKWMVANGYLKPGYNERFYPKDVKEIKKILEDNWRL